MSEKVKVSRELSEVLDKFSEKRSSNDLMRLYFNITQTTTKELTDEELALGSLEPLQLASILLKGYEIEQTPEEKLLSNFNWIKDEYKKAFDKGDDHYISKYQGMFEGVKLTLEILGKKIKGIND